MVAQSATKKKRDIEGCGSRHGYPALNIKHSVNPTRSPTWEVRTMDMEDMKAEKSPRFILAALII